MKAFVFASFFLFSLALSNVGTASSSANCEPEKRIYIDTYVTSAGGCRFHVEGWVDISIGLSGVSVDGYDITMTGNGGCGSHHFTSPLVVPPGNSQDFDEQSIDLQGIVEDIVNDNLN